MSDRKYYVLCADNCKFESMTKEQILAAIEQAVSTGEIKNVDTGFVTKIKEQNRGNELYFWFGTTAEYNALETKLYNCVYFKTDDTTVEDMNKLITQHDETLTQHDETIRQHGVTLDYITRETKGTAYIYNDVGNIIGSLKWINQKGVIQLYGAVEWDCSAAAFGYNTYHLDGVAVPKEEMYFPVAAVALGEGLTESNATHCTPIIINNNGDIKFICVDTGATKLKLNINVFYFAKTNEDA